MRGRPVALLAFPFSVCLSAHSSSRLLFAWSLSDMSRPSRDSALALVHEWTQSPSLRGHMLAVEAAMRAYAVRTGADPDRWGLTGLVHDFDYERFPNEAQRADAEHPAEGVRHLRGLGYPDDICEAILGHARYTGVPRTTALARTLFAVDELCGLVTATALVRPSKSVLEVEVKSVRKKFKDKAFARGSAARISRTEPPSSGYRLEEHIGLRDRGARQGIAADLGLAGVGDPRRGPTFESGATLKGHEV